MNFYGLWQLISLGIRCAFCNWLFPNQLIFKDAGISLLFEGDLICAFLHPVTFFINGLFINIFDIDDKYIRSFMYLLIYIILGFVVRFIIWLLILFGKLPI